MKRDVSMELPYSAGVREKSDIVEKDWYSPDELREWLGLGRTKTYELIQKGEIPSYRFGRVRRIRRRDIEDWLQKNRYHPGGG